MYREWFEEVKRVVCAVMRLNEEELMKSHREECVDGRFVLVKVLSERMTDEQIGREIGMTRQAVNRLRNGWKDRKRWVVRAGYEEVCKRCATK